MRDLEPDIPYATDQEWAEAAELARRLDRLPASASISDLRDLAHHLGTSLSRVYRLRKRYLLDPRVGALLAKKRGRKRGQVKPEAALTQVIEDALRRSYATREKWSLARFREEIAPDCHAISIAVPSWKRLKKIIEQKDQKRLIRAQKGPAAANARFLALPGGLAAQRPLQTLQIDHTLADVIVVDSTNRLPIGRPTLTVSLDVNTRAACGHFLSFEPPSRVSVAMCLTRSVMDKADWLTANSIHEPWPMKGKPEEIHVDNGAEFHSEAFKHGCKQYNIDIKYRPPGTPRFGGHIERYIGTLLGAIHLIPGTTFSNTLKRAEYDSAAHAIMTMDELDRYIALEIIRYNNRIHSTTGRAPAAHWLDQSNPPLNVAPADPLTFFIDFLPGASRRLQRIGVQLFGMKFWSETFYNWIGYTSMVEIRYDPRDISRVFVRLPTGYVVAHAVGYRAGVSLWEHRAAGAAERRLRRAEVNTRVLSSTVVRQRSIRDQAAAATLRAGRQQARTTDAKMPVSLAPPDQNNVEDDVAVILPHYKTEFWE